MLASRWLPICRDSLVFTRLRIGVIATVVAAALGCARAKPSPVLSAAPTRQPPASTSIVCEALLGRFVGLSAELGKSANVSADAAASSRVPSEPQAPPSPVAGRWWVRRCDLGTEGDELRVRLAGPGWFWTERDVPSFHLRQHVYFHVDAELYGKIDHRIGFKNGIISIWFHATHANVDVSPLGKIHPTSDNIVISVLRILASPLPPLNVDARARRRVETEVTERFEAALSQGYTIVYDIERRQADFALSRLPVGTVPRHPFSDDRHWLVNELVVAAPGGVHVLGPFERSRKLAMDVRVTRGAGIGWRAVCAPQLERAFAAIEEGEAGRVPRAEILGAGALSGSKLHEVALAAQRCRSYIVVSALGAEVSEAAIRVRLP